MPHRDRSRRWKAIIAAGLACMLPLLLWAVRNYHTVGRLALDTHGGPSLAYTIILHDSIKRGIDDRNTNPIWIEAGRMSEADRDAFFVSKAKEYVVNHPRVYARQSMTRFKDFWRLYPRQDVDFMEGRRKLTLISLMTEPFLIGMGFWGLWKSRAQWRYFYPAYVSIALLTAVYTLTTGQMRYRLPLMPLMILFSAYAVFNPTNRSSHH